MKNIKIALGGTVIAVSLVGNVQAALIGVTTTFPDVTLSSPTLLYDHNGIDSATGLLNIVANASTLNKASGPGNATSAQSYLSATDHNPDLMMSVQVDNSTGAFKSGSVSIGFGDSALASASNFGFSWSGTITDFGFLSDGKQFDATWTLNSDQYQAMPSGFSQFVNGYLAGASGGINIDNSAGFGTGNFGNDWVFGSSPTSSLLAPFTGGLDANALKTTSTVTLDAFITPVPIPAGIWLLTSGLAALIPAVRRKSLGEWLQA